MTDAAEATNRSRRVLEPIERVSEVLFGLIMVLTFTGSLSAAESGRAEVRTMLIGALGCNLAWGLIDAIMYLMDCLAARASSVRIVTAVRKAPTDELAADVIRGALPPVVASSLDDTELKKIRAELLKVPETSLRIKLEPVDWIGALAVFLLVFFSTIPVILPFLFMQDALVALQNLERHRRDHDARAWVYVRQAFRLQSLDHGGLDGVGRKRRGCSHDRARRLIKREQRSQGRLGRSRVGLPERRIVGGEVRRRWREWPLTGMRVASPQVDLAVPAGID